jgi:hypothetical protein
VFQNRVLRKTRGPKSYDVTAGWRKQHKYLHYLSCAECCSFCSTLGEKNWAEQEVHPKERETDYSVLVG